MYETIQGQGQLESWDRPEKKIPVSYRFDITTNILERPGFPRVATHRDSRGTVRSLSGESLSQGEYRLFASNGEVLKVQNIGLEEWVILAS
jgi:hypothetical protein